MSATFGALLDQYRRRSRTSRADLARLSGPEEAALVAIVEGLQRQPPEPVVRALADGLALYAEDMATLLAARGDAGLDVAALAPTAHPLPPTTPPPA